ncbi:protein FAM124A isoform X1 [Anguilla rostrata]|uniref:protein FAM124A isoform X1 n=1 Tax=Anguilla rostrata TaxID=7938 RepID=UPI0030CF176C
MSLSSEMEKNSTEDDCVDSGAETGGSDNSPMSSTSSELSAGEQQDPFLVSVHIITDPGQATPLQHAADALLSWIHPELQLFRVSERAAWQQRPRRSRTLAAGQQRALAVILFLQEEESYGCEDQVPRPLRGLQHLPWRYHHTERVNGRLLPLAPSSQDFFTLAPGTPLWAVRQVHYGKEIIRFTVYCRHHSFRDMVRMYRLLLQRPLAQRREDFCFFVVYSNQDTEIQLSFKRLPRGQNPAPTDSAVMEIRVRDVGGLVPLLPRPCTPISQVRWQTEDYDGNKILLQVRGSTLFRRRHTIAKFTCLPGDPSPIPLPTLSEPSPGPAHSFRKGPTSYRNHRYSQTSPRPRNHTLTCLSNQDLCQASKEEEGAGPNRVRWAGHRSRSLFCLPTADGTFLGSSTPSPSHSHSSSLAPPIRLKVEALVGAEETDVDTGRKVDSGGVDLTVVSAYSRPHPQPRPLSAPPQDPIPSFSALSCSSMPLLVNHAPLCDNRSTSATPSILHKPHPQKTCLPLGAQEEGLGREEEQSGRSWDTPAEQEQEFYI